MELRDALRKGTAILKEAGIEAAAVDAGILLCHAAGCSRAYLYAHGEENLVPELENTYFRMLDQRSKGMPVQYLAGHCEFMSLDFKVGPGVLIPRQDTEILVEHVINYCRHWGGRAEPFEILDLCTGSGCIAVSLAHYIDNCTVTASDISKTALGIAYQNAALNSVSQKVEFVWGDLFGAVSGRKFDIVVSNPPYIMSSDIPGLQREVREYEPSEALDGGPDGLFFYREIADKAHEYLKPVGMLALEVGIEQAGDVAILLERDFAGITILKDFSGIDRVVSGRLMPTNLKP